MRDLQEIFDTGPKVCPLGLSGSDEADWQYGKNMDWKTLPYTPHDVATIFRR